ncbi:5-methyltetrahydropteroyltriglutamate--homocysteine S-methyltransferase [Cellulophaga sp. F20128]|uniref:5-methyltetrahydropteroyltriglutamate-- homocysteine S-methyltransferase n=1 Tax=Cellulophaga sp. F20128 TaxID=2926413 RepID=UPI001FF6DEC7|nr:5-methyltetrahydropteroyltriglutamate--homocysteine S-methyltransferase [Cellulophaga sp. F20128]MCK0158242.1 5-methyltetrahydropteroyltriglutamate--homocysteine S-methyltransferase [Cellulophaga sp. F20128]
MKSIVLGYPRIGEKRELKKAIESYWRKNTSEDNLKIITKGLREKAWKSQDNLGIDLISSNDFSLYDQVLDMCITLGCIPERFKNLSGLDQYFAMARGLQNEEVDVTAMEMTKWFDTNYHYIVPEIIKNQTFALNSNKIINEYKEASALGIKTKPVIIGPLTFLLLGKEKESGFNRLELLDQLLPIYKALINEIDSLGVEYLQIDEPILATDLSLDEQAAITRTYEYFDEINSGVKIILANYFDCYGNNLDLALKLPVAVLHLDLVSCSLQLNDVLSHRSFNTTKTLSLGLVDGRNIWKNDFKKSLEFIQKARQKLKIESVWIGTSCSLLHSPYDLDLEKNTKGINTTIIQWLAFSKQKLKELGDLKKLATDPNNDVSGHIYNENIRASQNKLESKLIHNPTVKQRIQTLSFADSERNARFSKRQLLQRKTLKLPLFPTTTIGSFPQTNAVRLTRAKFKKGELSQELYDEFIKKETEETIRFQENIGLDVLVHGEFERNDMVEYFGEQLDGFIFTKFGWVQSYGTRCVKPPIIFGDVSRPHAMTVKWSTFAQSITEKPVKGMLTGPVTILQWSFVRNDQPKAITCNQIALAIRDEVSDLEKAGIKIIQIDEPAIREGLPLRNEDRKKYLDWAVKAFRISASGVADDTQIHTHMCYSEFNDIIKSIADMDADVITIETSRSEMELLSVFVDFKYPNEIGPGVYDIHSPRVPTQEEIESLIEKASKLLPQENIWVNPDCGLKTRDWPETKTALVNLVHSAKNMREKLAQSV